MRSARLEIASSAGPLLPAGGQRVEAAWKRQVAGGGSGLLRRSTIRPRTSWPRQQTSTERNGVRAPHQPEVAGSSPAPPTNERSCNPTRFGHRSPAGRRSRSVAGTNCVACCGTRSRARPMGVVIVLARELGPRGAGHGIQWRLHWAIPASVATRLGLRLPGTPVGACLRQRRADAVARGLPPRRPANLPNDLVRATLRGLGP